MFAELKTLKVDNYALANQQIEIIEAINKLINDKLTVMRKFYTCNLSYSSEPSLKNKTTIANILPQAGGYLLFVNLPSLN